MAISSTRFKPAADPAIDHGPPRLENGDRMTRDEFERRYAAAPNLKKAELLEGVVHVPSPVRQQYHAKQHSILNGWLFCYVARTPGVELGDNSTVRLDAINEPQPDCVLFIKPDHGGKVVIDEDGYINGAPDLVAEIAASSASYDVHDKLAVYQRSGVREYLIWRVFDGEIDWYASGEGGYEKLSPGDDGVVRSTIFPGLWLDPAALVREEFATLLDVLERGLNSPGRAALKIALFPARADPPG